MIPWRSAMLLLVVGVLIEFNWDSQLDSITCILRQCKKKYEVTAHSKHFSDDIQQQLKEAKCKWYEE